MHAPFFIYHATRDNVYVYLFFIMSFERLNARINLV